MTKFLFLNNRDIVVINDGYLDSGISQKVSLLQVISHVINDISLHKSVRFYQVLNV